MNWEALQRFAQACERVGATVPEPIVRGLHLVSVAEAYRDVPAANVLDMTDDEIRERVAAIAFRVHDRDGVASMRGMSPGIDQIRKEIGAEVSAAGIPALEGIVDQLRPKFDKLAKPLVTAARQFGFTYATTSDAVIEMADEKASAAWRAVPRAWRDISGMVQLRIEMSKVFGVSPIVSEARAAAFPEVYREAALNYSICFAEGENWSLGRGYYVEGRTVGHIDWLALAAGGLRLNSPAEVRAKLDARGIGELTAPVSLDSLVNPVFPAR